MAAPSSNTVATSAAAADTAKSALQDPAAIARTYAEVAQRSSRLITEYMNRQMARGSTPPVDELGVARSFMDMTSKLLANPYVLAQAQMSLVWDYFSLWQNSMQRFMGLDPAPVAAPAKDDKRFKDEEWKDCSTP